MFSEKVGKAEKKPHIYITIQTWSSLGMQVTFEYTIPYVFAMQLIANSHPLHCKV